MPTLTDEAFDALRTAVREIDFRTKRLFEWRTFTWRVAISESRLDVFLAVHNGIAGGIPTQPQLTELRVTWSDCSNQLIELSLLPESFEAITLTLRDGSPDPTVKTWIDGLVASGNQVDQDVVKESFGPLRGHASEYKNAFTKLSILRNAKIELEINQLPSLTNALVQKFNI